MMDISRRELKYLLNIEEMFSLKKKLACAMEEDLHNRQGGYQVRSLYFDTPYDTDFEEKIEGLENRRKIRLRMYDGNREGMKLELKEKNGDFQRKRSLWISLQEAEYMMRGNYEGLLNREEEWAKWLYVFMKTHSYQPKCIVEYNRFAFCRKENEIRITFDGNLRATEADLQLARENLFLYPVMDTSFVTMEVKYNEFLFSYIKEILGTVDKQQISNSKYCRARMVSKKGRI